MIESYISTKEYIELTNFKDSAYFCYCACVLCISRCSGFLWVVPTYTEIFVHGLKLCGESKT